MVSAEWAGILSYAPGFVLFCFFFSQMWVKVTDHELVGSRKSCHVSGERSELGWVERGVQALDNEQTN